MPPSWQPWHTALRVRDRRGVGTLEDHARLAIAALHPAGDVRRARTVAGFAASLRHRRLRIALHGHRRQLQERRDVRVPDCDNPGRFADRPWRSRPRRRRAGLFDLGRFGGRGRSLGHDQIRFCGRDRLTVIEQRRIGPVVGDRLRRRLGGVGDGRIWLGGVRRLNEPAQHGIVILGGCRLSGRPRPSGAAQRRMISVIGRNGLLGRDPHRLEGVLRLNEIAQHGIIIRGGRRLCARARLGETKGGRRILRLRPVGRNQAAPQKSPPTRGARPVSCSIRFQPMCADPSSDRPPELPARSAHFEFCSSCPRPIFDSAPATIALSPVGPELTP